MNETRKLELAQINKVEVSEKKLALRIDRDPMALNQIINDLAIIADLYGIKRPKPEILKILSEDIIEAYPFLHSKEIIQAFRLSSQSKIKVSLELYGKPLNAWLINQVLVAYCQYRNKKRIELEEKRKRQERMNEKRNVGQCPPETKIYFEKLAKQTAKKLKP